MMNLETMGIGGGVSFIVAAIILMKVEVMPPHIGIIGIIAGLVGVGYGVVNLFGGFFTRLFGG